MKRFLSMLCAAMLCMCCLALAACGGSAGSGAASSSASAGAPAADPAEKFVGDWKIAGAEMDGLTVVGDFSSDILGEEMDMSLSVAADNTGSFAFNDEAIEFTWELKDDNTITLKVAEDSADAESSADIDGLDVVYADDVLSLEMDDDDYAGKCYFSKDGTLEDMPPITTEGVADITSDSALVGTWKLAGVNMMGMSLYGDADELAELAGGDGSTTLEFEADGSASFTGSDAEWSVSPSGAVLPLACVDISIKALGDDIVIDAGEMLAGFDMVLLFAK